MFFWILRNVSIFNKYLPNMEPCLANVCQKWTHLSKSKQSWKCWKCFETHVLHLCSHVCMCVTKCVYMCVFFSAAAMHHLSAQVTNLRRPHIPVLVASITVGTLDRKHIFLSCGSTILRRIRCMYTCVKCSHGWMQHWEAAPGKWCISCQHLLAMVFVMGNVHTCTYLHIYNHVLGCHCIWHVCGRLFFWQCNRICTNCPSASICKGFCLSAYDLCMDDDLL